MADSLGNTVVVVGGNYHICHGFQVRYGISHRKTQARCLKHGDIIFAVTDAGDFVL